MRRPPDAADFARVPDRPEWIDTRGMLESGRAEVVRAEEARSGLLVLLPWRAVVSVVDAVPPALLAETVASLGGHVNVLCVPALGPQVAAALPGWPAATALLHTLRGPVPWADEDEADTIVFDAASAPPLEHVPAPLRGELAAALAGRPTTRFVAGELPARTADRPERPGRIAAAYCEGKPVAFCYAVTETAAWWDVSVDTLAAYRGRGLAGRAARTMTREMWKRGKAPVWGAMEGNTASRRLAERLGFEEIGRLCVFSAPR